MKKQHVILSGLAISALMVFLLVQRNNQMAKNHGSSDQNSIGSHQDGESRPGQTGPDGRTADGRNGAGGVGSDGKPQSNSRADGAIGADGKPVAAVAEKENNCFKFSYQHQPKNQNRDIEDFLNDTNAFPIAHSNVSQKSVCVKVNDKPVAHKIVKKDGKTEVVIGSVVGPESTIQVSYCVGNAPCKEACAIKTKNKVDELLSDSEMGGLENAELEAQAKELRSVASAHGDLMDSAVIRDWSKLNSKEWYCEK